MVEAQSNKSYHTENQPNESSSPSMGDDALAEIQAAMMEELGIGRKDMLPLQDVVTREPPQAFDGFPNLKPKGFVPGVDMWRNAIFDDVNPAEEEIDSIADGQLARIRRNLQNQNNTDLLPSKWGGSKTSSSTRNPTVKGFAPNPARIREGNGETPSGPDLIRNSFNPPYPSISINGEKRHKNQLARIDSTIARLRAANPAPGSSRQLTTSQKSSGVSRVHKASQSSTGAFRASKAPPKPAGRSLTRESSQIESRPSRKYQQSSTVSERTALQNSVWGSLDENAFLAFAIKPPPPNPSQSQNAVSNEKPSIISSNISSSSGCESSPSKYQTPPGYVSSQSKTEDRSHKNDCSTYGSPLKSNHNDDDKSSAISEQSCGDVKSKLNLTKQQNQNDLKESTFKRAKTLPDNRKYEESLNQLKEAFHAQRSIREAKVRVQKDADLGQPGLARLKNESGLLYLELQQNGNIVISEPIHDKTIFVTDPMNLQSMVIYQGATKSDKQTWRICFDLSQDKSFFMETIIKFRVQKLINGFAPKVALDTLEQPYSGKEPTGEIFSPESSVKRPTIAECTSLFGNLEIEKRTSDNELIQIDTLPGKMDAAQLSSYEKIKIDTFNDLAEIGDINPLSSTPEISTEPSISSLVLVDDDVLIEFLYQAICNGAAGTELHQLLDILDNQKNSTILPMADEDINRLRNYILNLKQEITLILGNSELFMKLPSNIADQYAVDKTQRIIEKGISKMKISDSYSLKMIQLATKLSTSPSDSGVRSPCSATAITASGLHGKETCSNRPSPGLSHRTTYSIDDLLKLRDTSLKFDVDKIENETFLLLSSKSKSAKVHYIDFQNDKQITPSEPSASTISCVSPISPILTPNNDKEIGKADNTQLPVKKVELSETKLDSRRSGLMSSRWYTEGSTS